MSISNRLQGYLPAIAGISLAVVFHYIFNQFFAPNFAGTFLVYFCALLIGAWCGYGPGLTVVAIIGVVVQFLFKPGFSFSKVDIPGVIVLSLVSILVSKTAHSRRQAEALLRRMNLELDQRVRQQTIALQEVNQALQLQIAELENLYGSLLMGVCFLDRDLRFVRVNERFAAWDGIASSAHLGRSLREAVPQPLANLIEPLCQQVLATGKAVLDYEMQNLPNPLSASVLDWTLSCSTVRTEDGAVVGLQVILQDVTDRERARRELSEVNLELRRSEEQYRTLANAIPHLCWIADADGWIFWYNQRWYDYTGTTPEQMEGWGWQSVHDPVVLPQVLERWTFAITTAEAFEMVFPLRSARGELRPFLTRAHPVKDASGNVLRWLGTNTDIAERQSFEDTLQRTNEALRRANEDLAQFAYVAAHDLQEPLRTVVSFSQLVLRNWADKLDAEAKEHLTFVVKAATRLSRLISDLLAYTWAASDNSRPSAPVPLDDVLAVVLENLKGRLRETGAQIVRQPLPIVEGDSARLGQVFQNLIGNALKYRKDEVPPKVEIEAALQDGEWILSVRDNGQGFQQQYADRVFGIFKRLHGQQIPGSGVGLAICKTIVERHGGRIWVESQEGTGSTFSFALPAAPDEGRIKG